MPADVEEYSRRSGPQAVLPEGLSYSYDAYGNLGFRREVQEDGKDYVVYYTLKQGDGCFGAIWMRGPADSDLNAPYILANSSLDGPGFRMVKAEGVATLCLPEEWAYTLSAAVGDRNPQGVLCEHAELDGPDGIRLETVRFAREDYEEAGLVIPASLEEHSQRPGNQSMLREGEEFSYDEWGNLGFALDTEDGGKLYYVLKQGSDAFGLVVLTLPAGVELPEAGYLLANFYLD